MNYFIISLMCALSPMSAFAEQISGPPVSGQRPLDRPGYLGIRPGPLLPEMVSLFNARFDTETEKVRRRGGVQNPFCQGDPPPGGPEAASLMILSLFENGQFRQGTGTIISGSGVDEGPDRVLTASHVVPPREISHEGTSSPLSRVFAFGAGGDLIAELTPVISGEVERLNRLNDPDMIFDDVAVLRPTRFLGGMTEEAWAMRGVPLAPEQPERLLALFQPPGSVALNPGMSGAGVFDPEGRLIGVFSYTLYLSGEPYLDRPETGYEKRFMNQNRTGGAATWADDLATVSETRGRSMRRDNVGYATPIRHAEIRTALNAGDLEPPKRANGRARVYGYPMLACLSVDVRYVGSVLPEASNAIREHANFETTATLTNGSVPDDIGYPQ